MLQKFIATVTVALSLCASGTLQAQPPAPPLARGAPDFGRPAIGAIVASSVVSGRVNRMLINPNGDVDGVLTDDGIQINFPPHLSSAILQVVHPGDPITVDGVRNPSVAVVRAQRITNTATNQSVLDQPPAGGAPPPAPQALQALSASGHIAQLLHTDPGDVNGVLLDDGTAIRFPPPAGVQIAALLKPGMPLYVSGYGTRSPLGTSIESTAIGSSSGTTQPVFGPIGRGGPQPGPGVAPPSAP